MPYYKCFPNLLNSLVSLEGCMKRSLGFSVSVDLFTVRNSVLTVNLPSSSLTFQRTCTYVLLVAEFSRASCHLRLSTRTAAILVPWDDANPRSRYQRDSRSSDQFRNGSVSLRSARSKRGWALLLRGLISESPKWAVPVYHGICPMTRCHLCCLLLTGSTTILWPCPCPICRRMETNPRLAFPVCGSPKVRPRLRNDANHVLEP